MKCNCSFSHFANKSNNIKTVGKTNWFRCYAEVSLSAGREDCSDLTCKQNGWVLEVTGCSGYTSIEFTIIIIFKMLLEILLYSNLNNLCFLGSHFQARIFEGKEPIQFFSIFQNFIVYKVLNYIIKRCFFCCL